MISLPALPRIGLGTAALGRPGYINLDRYLTFGGKDDRTVEKMQIFTNLVLDCLFHHSARTNNMAWIDCARSYGLSEQFLGDYLKKNDIDPNKIYVSSKWGYNYVADWKVELEKGEPHEVKDHSVENFLKQIEETNRFLGKYVNLYQIHSATLESGVLNNEDVLRELHKCRTDRGWAVGLSLSTPKQDQVLRRALEIEVGGEKLFNSVQCTYNIFEQRPGPALLDAHNAGMDIIIKEVVANGRILRSNTVKKYAEQLTCSADQLAIGCILAQPFKPRVLSGAVTPEQLQSNLKAEFIAERLKNDEELLNKIMKDCVMDSEEYWKERSELVWN